jgi:peptide/nickel transport system permease protein
LQPEPPSTAALLTSAAPDPALALGAGATPTSAAVRQAGEYRGRRLGLGFWVSASWLALVVLAAVFANRLPLQDPTAIGNNLPRLGPSPQHLLGTDELGRDLLSRVIYGARVSLVVGFASIAFGMLIGGTLGLLAGYYRGKFDAVVVALTTTLLAFPALIFLLAVVTFLGPNLSNIVLALGVLSIAPLTRIVRGNTLSFSNREFVLAARALGARDLRILFREILPNVLPGALAYSLVAVAIVIVVEGALAFLGLSVRPPTPAWGGMIAEGGQLLAQDPLVAFWPALGMFLTVLALNFVGDRLQAFFDIREGAL